MNTFFRLLSLNAARLIFVGGLLLALYAGLSWALNPEDRPDAEAIAAAQAAADQSASEAAEASASESEAAAAEATATPTAVPTVTAPPTASPQELIAAARPPDETTVQVLDAGGGTARVDAAIGVLEQIGYRVVAISPSSRDVTQTTVYFTQGAQAEAEGLRAREPRFQVVEPNQGLSEGVDIHVLVGTEF